MMSTSHADNHDLDKLARWRGDLSATSASGFPAFALFLVGPEDRIAHDVFREFRSSFQGLGAGFEHLVIFGQHGVSSTVHALLAKLGLAQEALPVLVLFSGRSASRVHTLPLPKGSADSKGAPGNSTEGSSGLGQANPCRDVLQRLESAAAAQQPDPDLASLPDITEKSTGMGALRELVEELSAAG